MQSLKTSGARTALFPALLCAAVLAACGGGGSGGANASVDGVAVDGELLVGVRAGAIGSPAVEAVIASQGAILAVDERNSFYRIHLRDGVGQDQATAALVHPDIVYVEPNYLAWGYGVTNDTYYASLATKVTDEFNAGLDAYTAVSSVNAVVVAVLDTGVRATHEVLSGNVDVADWKDYVTLANTTVVDDNGHGTQLAAIAGGWNPGFMTILPVKVADAKNVSNHAAIALGMSWAVNHGADIILLSLGSPTPSWTLQKAVQDAYAAGVLVVAAAGNDGTATARYPAGYQGTNQAVLSVSSATNADAIDVAHKANYGAWVNVLAPGADVATAAHTGDTDYVTSLSGSSYAAAQVAGMAAVLWSAYVPSTAHGAGVLTVGEVRNAILAGVDSYDRAASNSISVSGGRVNFQKAFAAATNIQSHGATPALPGSVVFNATSFRGGATAVGTVVLTDPAPVSTVVTLASNNVALVVPSSVTVLRGSRSATFAITSSPVAARATVTVTATAGGVSATGQVDLTTPGVSRVALSPATVVGGANVAGTVTLAGAAPVGGVAVTLSSSLADATFAATTVTVLANQTSASFTVRTAAVTAQKKPRITATANGTSAYADLTINPVLSGVSFTPSAVKGGATSSLRISLNGPQAADLSVGVTLSDPSGALTPESVVTTVVIPKGQTSKSITVTTVPVVGQATVSATASYGGVTTAAANLVVNVPAISTLVASTGSLIWWDASHVTTGLGTVTLDANVASTTTVYLSSSDSILAVPASISVPAGQKTATFVATPAAAVSAVTAVVSASLTSDLAVKKTASFQLRPALQAMTLSSTQVVGGVSVTGTVTLSAAAPAGNFVVALASDGARATVDPSVTVTAGQTTRTFTVTTVADPAPATVNVSASVNGVTKTVALKLTAPAISSVTFSPTSAFVGDSVTGTVTLAAAALGNTPITLTASDAVAVPGLTPIYVATGATSQTFTFTAGSVTAQKTVTVTATLNSSPKTGTVTIKPKGVVVTLAKASEWGGTAVSGTVTLPANAPTGGTVVSLASSATSAGTVPASVTVLAGAKTASFSVTTLGVDADALTTISATANSYTSRAAVTVQAATDFTVTTPVTISGTGSASVTITLNARAGAAGKAITSITSNDTNTATVGASPPTSVAAQATTATFSIDGVASGSTTVDVVIGGVTHSVAVTVGP